MSESEVLQFDGTGDYATWKSHLRTYAQLKRLRQHLLGARRPVLEGDGEARAALVLLQNDYDDKAEQMFGIIVHHTVPNSGPWTICAKYGNRVDAGTGVYHCNALVALLDTEYLGATSRLEKLRALRAFFTLTQKSTVESYISDFAGLVLRLSLIHI